MCYVLPFCFLKLEYNEMNSNSEKILGKISYRNENELCHKQNKHKKVDLEICHLPVPNDPVLTQ